jgi:prophage antirepressor-like protein
MVPFIELLVVLAFGAGWLVLEAVCRRLDREKEARAREVQGQQSSDARSD